ncbi:MAG: M23 family metallopeptidase [Terriglobales bacterium]
MWRSRSLLGVLSMFILMAVARAAAAPKNGWDFRHEPVRIVNGSPVLFRVSPPKSLRSLTGSWLGHRIDFTFDPRHKDWFALAGASIETNPGVYSFALHAETSAGQAISYDKKIAIQRQHYPQVILKVPGKYTAPSPEEQKEIDEDKKIKQEAFKTESQNREWDGSFHAPVDAEISDLFGVRRVFNGTVQSTHQGLDFRVPAGTTVDAVNRGTVILARPLFFEGNCIVIDHGQGLLTLYLHLSKFLVKEGDSVDKGQPIALSGGTGRATGPHLHLAVRWQGVYLDPQTLLKLNLP